MLVSIMMIVSAFADVVSLGAVFPFISVLTKPETVFSMYLIKDVIGFLGFTRPDQVVLPLTLIFIVAVLLANTFRLLVLWMNNRLTYATGHDLSTRVYQVTLYQPYLTHSNRNSSEVISGIIKVNSATLVLFQMLTMINSTLISLAVLITLMVVEPFISGMTILGFGLCYALIAFVTRNKLRKNSQRSAVEATKLVKVVQEGLGGIREVLLNGNQDYYVDIFRRADRSNRHAIAMNNFLSGSPRFVIEASGMILIALLAYGLSFKSGGLGKALPLLGAMALGAQRLLPALQQIYGAVSGIIGSHADLRDALELIEQPLPDKALQSLTTPMGFNHDVRFENVFFRYDQDGPWVMEDFNLRITKGARVGFVGITGSGKSTALDLFMGLLLPTKGLIVVDDLPLDKERIRAWQRIIAHVPQNIFLADTTIAENIAFGEPPETINMEKVKLAAQKSQIASFIENSPEGYKTVIGERGVRLSGGQRQRLGIARALYKQASVLVFDEATSALDNATERDVMDAIEALGKNITVLIIAHRLSTVSNCDMIVQMEDGKIVAQGNYEELLESSVAFRNIAEI